MRFRGGSEEPLRGSLGSAAEPGIEDAANSVPRRFRGGSDPSRFEPINSGRPWSTLIEFAQSNLISA